MKEYLERWTNHPDNKDEDKTSRSYQIKKLLQKVEDLLGLPYTLDMLFIYEAIE